MSSAPTFATGHPFALVFYPLTCLPYPCASALIWAPVYNIGFAYVATAALCRRVLPGAAAPRERNLVLAASILPAAHCLYAGQTNLLVFSLVAFAGIAILDARWWRAALLLAVAAHIKEFGRWPGRSLLAACWPRRLAWRLPLALLAIAALPLVAKPPAAVLDSYIEWYKHLVGPAQIRHTYRDAWTIWELISSPVNAQIYTVLQLAAAAAALGLCLWQKLRLPPARLVLFVLASWTAWQLIFGPGTERNTFALIAPLTGWAVVAAFRSRQAAWLRGHWLRFHGASRHRGHRGHKPLAPHPPSGGGDALFRLVFAVEHFGVRRLAFAFPTELTKGISGGQTKHTLWTSTRCRRYEKRWQATRTPKLPLLVYPAKTHLINSDVFT